MFSTIHSFTARWEGGISDHPADPGGFTVYGVCRAFLEDFARRQGAFLKEIGVSTSINEATMRRITPEQAALILKREFYDGISALRPACLAATYDARVNCGKVTGLKFLQEAARHNAKPPLVLDGLIGPKTLAACAADNDYALAIKAIGKREAYYHSLTAKRPNLKVFLKGWLNRTNDLKRFVAKNFK